MANKKISEITTANSPDGSEFVLGIQDAQSVKIPYNTNYMTDGAGLGTTALWENITGPGKPESAATRNVFRGNWLPNTIYYKGDIVLDTLGYGWMCTYAQHTTPASPDTPIYPTQSNTYWTLYTIKGMDGIDGTPGLNAVLSNDTYVLAATSDGTVPSSSYTNSGTDIYVYEGDTQLIYDGVGTDSGTWTVTTTATDITASMPIDMGDYVTYPQHSAIAADNAKIVYNIIGKTSAGNVFSLTKIQTFNKSKAGAYVTVFAIETSSPVITKESPNAATAGTHSTLVIQGKKYVGTDSTNFGFITITGNGDTEASTATDTSGTPYTFTPSFNAGKTSYTINMYDTADKNNLLDSQHVYVLFKGDTGSNSLVYSITTNSPVIFKTAQDAGTSGTHSQILIQGKKIDGNTTTNYGWVTITGNGDAEASTATNTASSSYSFTAANNAGKTSYTIKMYDSANKTTLLDTQNIPIIFTGEHGVTCVLTNESSGIPCDSAGNPTSYSGSGTDILVYQGTTAFSYVSTITGANQFTVSSSSTGITAGAISAGANKATVANASAMTADPATIIYTITARASTGSTYTITKVQSFNKTKTGTNSISCILTNEASVYPATAAGHVNSYIHSGTDIYIYDGITVLDYDGVGTANGTWKIASTTPTNITVGTISSTGTSPSRHAAVADHSNVDDNIDSSAIDYNITGKSLTGVAFSITKTQTFSKSKHGYNSVTSYLTNESVTLACNSSGIVSDFTPANGNFVIYDGLTNATSLSTFSVYSQTGCTVSISTAGAITVTSMNSDTDTASAVFEGIHNGVTLYQTLSLTKSKSSIIVTLSSDKQTVYYNAAGALTPTSQTITFTAQKQNTSATVNWTLTNMLGTTLTAATYLSAVTGDTVTMTAANFTTAAGSTGGVIVTASLTDGTVTVSDKMSVIKVSQGNQGDLGPTVNITSNHPDVFTSVDGVLEATTATVNPDITFTANTTNMTGQTYVWQLSKDSGAYTQVGTSSTYVLSQTTFGANTKKAVLKVTVTYNTIAYTDTVTIARLEKSTAEAGATVGATIGTNLAGKFNSANIGNYFESAAIGNAYIGDVIQSGNYSATNHTGWQIQKSGNITSFGTLAMYNSAGQLVFGSGDFNWNNATGTNLPAANATVGAVWGTNISGQPANSAIYNSAVSISSNGSLTGAGGGQVTIGGLGYTGALDANKTYVDGNGAIQGVSSGAGTTVQNSLLDTLSFGTTNVTASGNTFKKTGGTPNSWDSQAYSKESYTLGAYCSFSPDQTNAYIMCGLNTDPQTDASYGSIDYSWYMVADGSLRIYESGGDIGSFGTYAAGDILSITYDGSNIRYYQNGNLKRTVAVNITNPLFFDSSIYSSNGSVSKVKFGPMSSNAWGSITGQPAGIYNSNISIGSNGVLSGAGGGTVTIGGLGYTGALDANKTYVDGSGNIQGVSSGAGTTVQNSLLVPSINSAATTAIWSGVSGAGRPADNATVGATIGVNLSGQMNSSNISTYIANAAIGSALIGSINLVGTGTTNFSVKTATSGARMEMNGSAIKVYDASGVLRVQLGDLSV